MRKKHKKQSLFLQKNLAFIISLIYTYKACEIRRRGGKLLSYQVISTENCPRRTGAKGSPVFSGCACKQKTHGKVCETDKADEGNAAKELIS